MGESLNPTLLNRISHILRPDFARTLRARRIAAGLLVLLAGFAALRPDSGRTSREVVVAARDLSPGVTLGDEDVVMAERPANAMPDGAATGLREVLGATLAGPARRGEVITDARILGSRLVGLSAGPDARVVPLHLADAAVPDLIRAGDVVDVVGAPDAKPDVPPRVLASNAVVVLVSNASRSPGASNDRVVLVALPASTANALAGATLVQRVTLTIR